MKVVRLLFFIALLIPVFPCWGAFRNVTHYTISDGLSNNAVYSIVQDTKGRMWFGTIDGLHSFDGNHIRVWRDNRVESLGACIYTILEDSMRLYVGSERGLSVFDLLTESFSDFQVRSEFGEGIHSSVSHVMRDHHHNIWISTAGQGVFRYDLLHKTLHQYMAIGKVNCDFVYYIMEDSFGTVWLATREGGISRYMPSQDMFQPVASGDVKDARVLFEDSAHRLWVGSGSDGLYLLDREQGRLIQKIPPLSFNHPFQVRRIVEWQRNHLLLASDEGLTIYNILTGEVNVVRADNKHPEGLNDNYLHELFIDRENALWIGTYFGGVNYVSSLQDNFLHYYKDNSQLDASIISVFAHADKDNLWIGTDDAGFFYWDRHKQIFRAYQPLKGKSGPTYHNIHALLQDGDKLFVGMYMGGLDILDLRTGVFKNYKSDTSPHSLYSSEIYALYKDSRQKIWVGTTSGLNVYKPQSDDFERIYELHGASISYIFEDSQQNLWVCSLNRGVYCLNHRTGKWIHYFHQVKDERGTLPTNQIITGCLDMQGELWLGTDGDGLLRYDRKKDLFVRENLPAHIRVVYKILPDKDKLWFTTNNGMFCYQSQTSSLKFYNKKDGLQENLFLPNSGIQLSDGTIMVGGVNGFNEFHPDKIQTDLQVPTVILTDFQMFNKPVIVGSKDSPLKVSITYADRLILDHSHSMFSFSVATLSYINTSKNRYRYRLKGFEKDWTETSNAPHVTYTDLPAGSYVFQVSASNSDGVWNENAISFPIKVLPPWWASSYMIAGYVLLGLACLVYSYYRINRIHRRRMTLLTIKKDREIYQSKIEFFTNVMHEIRTPLTLILAPLEHVMKSSGTVKDVLPQLQVIERNAERLLTLVNQLMDFRKVESGGMNVILAETNVKTLLMNVYQRFQLSADMKHIKISLTMPEEPCYARIDQEAFTKVISNLLSNALKFTDTYIGVDLLIVSDRKLEVRVRDNGRGIDVKEQGKIFSPFYQVPDKTSSERVGTGVGLSLVKKLVDLMHGSLTLESELGAGSTFIVCFDRLVHKGEEDLEKIPSQEVRGEDNADMPEGQYRILIVDDNQDLREYLLQLLSVHYQVFYAVNGKDAWEQISQNMPDLIISDVMMPVMDGIQLCHHVKSNLSTSHIPVVMLTAKASSEDYVEGLENGADVYLEKPFSGDVINAQIASIFRNRERLKKEFKTKPMVASVSISKLDTLLIDKISKIVEKRMTDSDFTVDVLAQEVGISRSGLFTKIKAISGMTPNDYIRLIRLKKAAYLLAEEGVSSSEACFRVGFSSPSYFAKCFQAQFGIAPAEFRKKGCRD
ncbi:MAG TPA: ATP-binding protein [Bacteroides mediterraneensis]|uniref:hybrid sensor histidine kinase/response regulator transcription factor n=1 Tax=Bacteroides mediterraneensis TaxID=1841856 RepID=UPI00262E17C3|nr:two-component regulator propeller domain-containing protein [Bacteroides mediterraneensis]HJH63228.1 ATP-binding protein [Bacteroides mediterraneensis]